ncbi:hypothetical protein UVI_02046180 [Ustilaginoidea virens]|uniref:Uncharacterized protein n=1 Tax=Ustilaginoidea virens TaxID=1159556 RepID=A0A1B5L0M6_USTVR|nr:hypothetical protein UVI_02046180 [Ustilaginoidea virens]
MASEDGHLVEGKDESQNKRHAEQQAAWRAAERAEVKQVKKAKGYGFDESDGVKIKCA